VTAGNQPGGESALAHYLRVLRRGAWAIVLATALGATSAVVLSKRQENLYRASADIFLSSQDLAYALSNVYPPYVDPVRASATQANLARTPAVAAAAVTRAGVPGRTAGGLLARSSVSSGANSDTLIFSVTDPDAEAAARLATAYANAYTAYRRTLDTRTLVRAREELGKRIAELKASGREDSSLFASLSEKDQQLRTMEVLQDANVLLVRPARGAAQVQPEPMRNGIIGGVLGFVLGIALAFLLDALNTRVRTTSEVEQRLELPLLGRIPELPRKLRTKNRLAMVADPQSPVAESYRILATNVEFVNLDRDARTVMISSARREEGKSTTAANLAVALARAGRRVVLVDLDLRRPSLHRYFNPGSRPGLTHVLVRRAQLEDALIPVDIPLTNMDQNGRAGSLEVLWAGPSPPNPAEMARSHALSEILSQLEQRADLVLVDSPPLLGISDSVALSAKVDGLILVMRLSTLKRPVLDELHRVLDAAPTVKLGWIATGTTGEPAYGYGYGYGYGDRKREEALR
jgi:polysaccharide biosynthesis transport protein